MSKFDKIWNDNLIGRSETDYTWQRANEYISIGDQLDMLWHAMDDGTLPKVESFYNHRKEVKENNPPVTIINGVYGAIIKDGKVEYMIKWDVEKDPEYPHDSDGIVKITQETVDYVGFMPCVGDQFITTGEQYSVPPGTFISSNPSSNKHTDFTNTQVTDNIGPSFRSAETGYKGVSGGALNPGGWTLGNIDK